MPRAARQQLPLLLALGSRLAVRIFHFDVAWRWSAAWRASINRGNYNYTDFTDKCRSFLVAAARLVAARGNIREIRVPSV